MSFNWNVVMIVG